MKINKNDQTILRDLATQYTQLCESELNKSLIEEWRRLNNMQSCRPMIHVNCGLIGEEIKSQMPEPTVEDERLKGVERQLNRLLLWDAKIGDDRIFHPWFTVRAEMFKLANEPFGIEKKKVWDETSRGWRNLPVLKSIEDLEELKPTEHRVLDPNPPKARMLEDIFGDILPVHVKRSTVYGVWGGTDLSQAAGAHFGLEELMMALIMEPEMIHKFMSFTRDAVLANLKQGEKAGDWSTDDSWYYLTPAYCDDLPDPAPNSHGTKLKELAWFFHAQEFESVSPGMFEEFLLDYQLPIMELFGKVTYGCCETLDTKLDALKRIPNLTKILSGPLSDPACYPETFGDKCVISWRPVTTIIASEKFDEDKQRKQIREGFQKLKGCNIEVHMHEPMTVQGDLERVRTWVKIAREETV